MQVTYNKLNQPSNLITFTDIPNILKVTDDDSGVRCQITINVRYTLYQYATEDRKYSITILGDTVQNVVNPTNAVNRLFHISQSEGFTAASLARALRNCSNISANFTIINRGNTVYLQARRIGDIFEGLSSYYSTNIPSEYITTNITRGSASSPLYNALVNVDVYSDGEYITTLEKNFYGGEVAFDMSPLLTTLAVDGRTVPYDLNLSALVAGQSNPMGNIGPNYITPGYMVNQGNKYIALGSNMSKIAMTYMRDEEPITLYIYKKNIYLSYYKGSSISSVYVKLSYLNSAYQEIGKTETNVTPSQSSTDPRLYYISYNLRDDWFEKSHYLDVTLGSETIRFNVIKPIKATEYCQRVYWRNSLGGVSFFDFTGRKTETRNLSSETYEGNIFNYYEDSTNTLDKVYDTSVEYKVTLRTHIIEKQGTYIFNDMIQSHNVWTEVGGETYRIIIENYSMEEGDINDSYTCQITYRYSQNPTLI